MADQDVETLRGAYEAFARGDIPAVIGIMDRVSAETSINEP